MPGPLPRSVPPVLLLASSPRATASHPTSHVRHTENTPTMQLQQGKYSRGCSHSLMFRLPRSLAPQVAPTAEALSLQGSQDIYTTHSPVGYLPRDVASLRIRHEQLIRLDFHQLDCSLVGRSDVVYYYTYVYLTEKGFWQLMEEKHPYEELFNSAHCKRSWAGSCSSLF